MCKLKRAYKRINDVSANEYFNKQLKMYILVLTIYKKNTNKKKNRFYKTHFSIPYSIPIETHVWRKIYECK